MKKRNHFLLLIATVAALLLGMSAIVFSALPGQAAQVASAKTVFGQLVAGGKTYDVCDESSNVTGKFGLGDATYGTQMASLQNGANQFVVAGIAYRVDQAAKSPVATLKLGSTRYPIAKAPTIVANAVAASTLPTTLPAAWPTALATGVPAGIQLTAVAHAPRAGSDYVGCSWSGSQTILLAAGQVITFTDCKFDAAGGLYAIKCPGNLGAIVLVNCTLQNPASSFVYGDNWSLSGCRCQHSISDGFKPGANCTLSGCYITDIGYGDGTGKDTNIHADGVQIRGGTNITISGNVFDLVSSKHCNSNLFIQTAGTSNVAFTHNHCSAGDWTISAFDSLLPQTISITSNVFAGTAPKGTAHFGILHLQAGVVANANTFEDGTAVK